MPRIIEYTENEGTAQTSANTLIQLINSSKSATAGLSGFHIKTIMVSTVSAILFGETFSMLFTSVVGPGMSFLAGAGFGFMGGLVHRWRTDCRESKDAFAEFPELMEHHLRQADPAGLRIIPFEEWKKELPWNVVRQGYAVAALYSASPAIQRIREMREEELIAAMAARASAAAVQ